MARHKPVNRPQAVAPPGQPVVEHNEAAAVPLASKTSSVKDYGHIHDGNLATFGPGDKGKLTIKGETKYSQISQALAMRAQEDGFDMLTFMFVGNETVMNSYQHCLGIRPGIDPGKIDESKSMEVKWGMNPPDSDYPILEVSDSGSQVFDPTIHFGRTMEEAVKQMGGKDGGLNMHEGMSCTLQCADVDYRWVTEVGAVIEAEASEKESDNPDVTLANLKAWITPKCGVKTEFDLRAHAKAVENQWAKDNAEQAASLGKKPYDPDKPVAQPIKTTAFSATIKFKGVTVEDIAARNTQD